MAGEKIEVNQEVLEEEISNLGKLLNEMESSGIKALEINGQGYTKQYMDIVEADFVKILNALKILVNCTLNCLNEVKDGYVEIDEETRDAIERFREEVLS